MGECVMPTFDDSTNMSEFSSHSDCITFLSDHNFDWKTSYIKYMSDIINIINELSDISRLYLLIKIDLSNSNLSNVVNDLKTHKLCQPPEAVELTNNLKDLVSEADPIYLDLVGEIYVNNQIGLSLFIEDIISKNITYPKIQEYNDRIKLLNVKKNLTINFKIEEFLHTCPDPENYFKNIKVNSKQIHYNESLSYLSAKFDFVKLVSLTHELTTCEYNLTKTVENLQNSSNLYPLKNQRKWFGNRNKVNYKTTEDIEFLKEIAYIDHKEEILKHIEVKKTLRRIQIEEAKAAGQLCSCECCFDNDLLSSDIHLCPVGHSFCLPCIKKGIEVSVGANKIDFKCFADCDEEFNLPLIKNVVDDKLFEHIMRLKQSQEIKNADIEGLETCAFCNYSVILPTHIKIITCLNPECKKETCRKCREESHTPYRCDEIEKAPEVYVRTMIENKMTDVLIRTCYYCNQKFVKEEGCNKMTCSCGKQMCYICRTPLGDNYAHFYHPHPIENKCPLYTDENIVHTMAVEAVARLIMNELKSTQPELLSKIDIDKILPELKKCSCKLGEKRLSSALNVPQIVAKLIGQNVEDVENLQDMRSFGIQPKKARQ